MKQEKTIIVFIDVCQAFCPNFIIQNYSADFKLKKTTSLSIVTSFFLVGDQKDTVRYFFNPSPTTLLHKAYWFKIFQSNLLRVNYMYMHVYRTGGNYVFLRQEFLKSDFNRRSTLYCIIKERYYPSSGYTQVIEYIGISKDLFIWIYSYVNFRITFRLIICITWGN